LRFWDDTGREVREGISGNSPIAAIALSGDDRFLARVAWDDEIHIYDTSNGARLEPVFRHRMVRAIAFDPVNTQRIVSAGRDGFARIWMRDVPAPIQELQHPAHVRGLDISPDGRFLATACQDRMVRIWELDSGTQVGTPMQHTGSVNDVEYSPDGALLVTGCDDGTARVWDVRQRMEILAPVRHAAPVLAVAFSPQGNRIASAGQDHFVQIADIPAGWTENITTIQARLQKLTGMRIDQYNVLQPLTADQWRKLDGDAVVPGR
jgi:WD40 repeat protein